MAVAQRHRGRADSGRRRQRHHRSRGLRAGRKAGRADLRDREPARRRRHHRRQHGRQGRARRPHRPGLWLDRRRECALYEAALRHARRFHAGGAVRPDAAGRHHGRRALQDARRARRRREGQARSAELFDRRRRIGRAFRRRAACGERRLLGAAYPVQGRRMADRDHRGAHRLRRAAGDHRHRRHPATASSSRSRSAPRSASRRCPTCRR